MPKKKKGAEQGQEEQGLRLNDVSKDATTNAAAASAAATANVPTAAASAAATANVPTASAATANVPTATTPTACVVRGCGNVTHYSCFMPDCPRYAIFNTFI